MLYNPRTAWKNFSCGILNIIRWTPVVWRDRDFDDGYVIRLLYYKFRFMEDFFRSGHTHAVNTEKNAEKVKIAKNLCKRLWDQNYLSNALVKYEIKYGNKDVFHFETSETSGNTILVWDWKTKQQEKYSSGHPIIPAIWRSRILNTYLHILISN